ncbi:MAG: hypothetical protein HRU09_13250 [Oligoflexales bacterium]|nr:hypothetical protein [Oligoflexales bacterium]
MKYEAKKVDDSAMSMPAQNPWLVGNRWTTEQVAIDACESLGQGFQLITNVQWMSMVTDMTGVGENWTSGIVGTGTLIRGHSDSFPNKRCPASENDADVFFESSNCIGNTAGDSLDQRRTHVLSNGAIVWDVAGNATDLVNMELVPWNQPIAVSGHQEFTDVSGNQYLALTDLLPQIAIDNLWNSTFGIGKYRKGDSGKYDRWLTRGGKYDEFNSAGLFTSDFEGFEYGNHTGFRCSIQVP